MAPKNGSGHIYRGKAHFPKTPSRTPSWMANVAPVIPTPPTPSPVRHRDANANLVVDNGNQQRAHGSPLGRIHGANASLGVENGQRTHSSPLGRVHGANLMVENGQRVGSSSPLRKKEKKREMWTRCKLPFEHVPNADGTTIEEIEEVDPERREEERRSGVMRVISVNALSENREKWKAGGTPGWKDRIRMLLVMRRSS